LRPYLEAVRVTRAVRIALLNTLKALPQPHTPRQIAAFRRAYKLADLAHTDACKQLAGQVSEVVEE
jgi:hypothetical protein